VSKLMMNKSICRYFKGDRPCKYYWVDKSHDCKNCNNKSPIKKRILLIRLNAFGGVIRTTPLITGLKKKYPDSFITWLVEEEFYDLLKNNPEIDRIMKYNYNTMLSLQTQKFDILINLDKSQSATALAMNIDADKKMGYGLDKNGLPFPLNKGAMDHYEMCLDNWGKKSKNQKTYQNMIFDIAELEYKGEKYVFNLSKEDIDFASAFIKKNNLKKSDIIIGLNTGCGQLYPNKKWSLANYLELIQKFTNQPNVKFLLFGGPSEVKTNSHIYKNFNKKIDIIDTTNKTTISEFSSLINLCTIFVTGDTFGMHLAIALKRPVVALFGPTPAQEIDMYDLGTKLIAKVDCLNCYDQFPCSRKPNCMDTITTEEVFNAVKYWIK
ncbi:MAG: glycosyltransferase family 9 protein, partial [Nanoarchaeota archaeon]